MKYTKQEKLDIGRQIYDSEITRYQATETPPFPGGAAGGGKTGMCGAYTARKWA